MGHLLCRALCALAIATATGMGLTACGDATDPPAPGSVRVTVATSGADRDADGYFVVVDDTARQPVAANGSVTLPAVRTGVRAVQLVGIATNCTGDDLEKSVSVTAGQVASVDFALQCVPRLGSIAITIATSGPESPTGPYRLGLDDRLDRVRVAAPNELLTLADLREGSHVLWLGDVAENCVVSDANPRSVVVSFGETVATRFDVTCQATNRLPPGMVLAFSDAGRIARINSDGSGLVRLTEGPSDDQPAWSPDGKRIAFTRTDAQSSDIYVMNADGSDIVRRTSGGYNADPAWSPDGKHIAFSALADGSSNVYVMSADSDGTPATTVLAYPGWDAQPAWSPDGSAIALVSDWVAYDTAYDIFVSTPDGSRLAQLTSSLIGTPFVHYYHPTWSPDGGKLAVVTCTPARDTCDTSRLAIMNADGSEMTTLMTRRGLGQLSWSPDGRTIAFSSVGSLGWIRTDGSEQGKFGAEGRSPAWRP